MIPEALAEAHEFAGLITVLGFLVAFILTKISCRRLRKDLLDLQRQRWTVALWYLKLANDEKIAKCGDRYRNKIKCKDAIDLVKGSADASVNE